MRIGTELCQKESRNPELFGKNKSEKSNVSLKTGMDVKVKNKKCC